MVTVAGVWCQQPLVPRCVPRGYGQRSRKRSGPYQPFSIHGGTRTRARNRTPITLRFEPTGFGDGNAQPHSGNVGAAWPHLQPPWTGTFLVVIHSILQTTKPCLILGVVFKKMMKANMIVSHEKNSAHKYDWKMIAFTGKTFPTKMIRKVNFSHQND